VADALGSLADRVEAVEKTVGAKPAEVRKLKPRQGPTSAGG
jgi:hypothetical protein